MHQWHVTTDASFSPRADFEPQGEGGFRGFGAGLFVTPNPELWQYLWRQDSYATGKMYAAEIDVSRLASSECQQMGMPDRDQWWIPGAALKDVKVKRIMPIEVATKEARRDGYGFAMLSFDLVDKSRLCVIDHQQGWGALDALCGRFTDGNPIKWTTIHDAVTGPLSSRLCGECKEVLAPIARRHATRQVLADDSLWSHV